MYVLKDKMINPRYVKSLAGSVIKAGTSFLQETMGFLQVQGPESLEKVRNLSMVKNSVLFRLIPQVLYPSTLKNFDFSVLRKIEV